MRPFGTFVVVGWAAFLAGCGEGQFYDEIEARACPEATPLGGESAPRSNAVVLSLRSFDCQLGSLVIEVQAVDVEPGVTMAYLELVDVPDLLVVRSVAGGSFPAQGTAPFFSSGRPVVEAPGNFLLVHGGLQPSAERGGAVFVIDFDLIRTPFRDEVVELGVEPATSALFGADYRPLEGVAFVGTRIRFR
ncbi:MAG: hypothetical protein ACREMK_00125 [Gemmatimonadota bacterium]